MQSNSAVGDRAYYETWYADRDWHFYLPVMTQLITLSEPGPVLDVGAGVGFFVECASRWGIRCSGIEGSQAGVEIARARVHDLDIRQHFLSEPFPFADASFQSVLMNQVIEHLEPPVALTALRESFRVLKPNGLLLVLSPNLHNALERDSDPTHINMYTPGTLSALVRRIGFREVRALDFALPAFGTSRLGRRLANAAFRITRWDRLSATANCAARK